MENFKIKFLDELVEAEKRYQSADQLVIVTFPVVKDAQLLVKALEEIYTCLIKTISVILKLEYMYKRVTLYNSPERNLEIFFAKCASSYGLSKEDALAIKEVFVLEKKHKDSGFEFSRNGKRVILDDDLGTSYIDRDKLRNHLYVAKKLLKNTHTNFKASI